MGFKLLLCLGTGIMILVTWITGGKYGYSVWKRILFSIVLTILGVAGTKIMAFIETGQFAGLSFYGSVFFTPLLMLPVGRLLRMKSLDTLDLCAPAECSMLVIMKISCYISGCCSGRVLHVAENGDAVRFPSQFVEGGAALVITIILIVLLLSEKQRGSIYPWYMIIYGVVRFALNFYRETTPFIGKLPAGNFWSLISIGLGGVLLYWSFSNRKKVERSKHQNKPKRGNAKGKLY